MDYSGLAFPKGESRRDHKLAQRAKEKAVDTKARTLAWDRCKGRCEVCDKRVTRSGDLIFGAHFHHVIYRSRGGRRKPTYRVVCGKCHDRIHGVSR